MGHMGRAGLTRPTSNTAVDGGDPLGCQAAGVLGLCPGNQATVGGHHTPPRLVGPVDAQYPSHGPCRARRTGLSCHLGVGEHVTRPCSRDDGEDRTGKW
jgi:hypothetical protein